MANFETHDAAAALELLMNATINSNDDLQNYHSSPDFSLDEGNDFPSPYLTNSTTKEGHRK